MIGTVARVANVVLVGMLTGNEFGSLVTVHPALDALPLPARIEAERAMTRCYGGVMPVFMSSTIASFLPVLATTRPRTGAAFRFTLAGLACYGAMLGITLTLNVPINNRLLEIPAVDKSGEEFAALTGRWRRLHVGRNLLNVAGLTCTALGALSNARSRG